jgi:signal peptidase II
LPPRKFLQHEGNWRQTRSPSFAGRRNAMTSLIKFRLLILFLVLGCTVGCDQTSKHFARLELPHLGYVALPGGIGELRLAENTGSFLSLGASFPLLLRTFFFIIGAGSGLLVLVAYLVGYARLSWLQFAGLALITAGGASNVIDRITRHGFVTDFIYLRIGPLHTGIFNIADFMIMIGIALLIATLWQHRAPQAKPQ